jgi:hypothetical protein
MTMPDKKLPDNFLKKKFFFITKVISRISQCLEISDLFYFCLLQTYTRFVRFNISNYFFVHRGPAEKPSKVMNTINLNNDLENFNLELSTG